MPLAANTLNRNLVRSVNRSIEIKSSDVELPVLTLEDFKVLCVLGVGTYGVVKLVTHKATGTSVALKVLSKEYVVTTRQEKHILRERAIHSQLQHSLVAKLYGTFQDDDCLYFVLEYLPGGELWSLLYSHCQEQEDIARAVQARTTSLVKIQTPFEGDSSELRLVTPSSPLTQPLITSFMPSESPKLDVEGLSILQSPFGGLKEEYVLFYMGCILSVLEYLHDQNVMYRDLKLENLVLDRDGYLKIIDFGLSKMDGQLVNDTDKSSQRNARNLTFCGSIDYMAPEVLLRQSYDRRVDIWSFGIIMYELLLGKTPFYHTHPRELGRRITHDDVNFPKEFQEEFPLACDLIYQLLKKNPNERLCAFEKIKSHRFFSRKFPCLDDWQRLQRRECVAPFIPTFNGPFDSSFFQVIDTKYEEELESRVEPYFEDGSNVFGDF